MFKSNSESDGHKPYDDSEYVFCGYLYMRTPALSNKWVKKFFWLQKSEMMYQFKNQDMKQYLDCFSVQGCTCKLEPINDSAGKSGEMIRLNLVPNVINNEEKEVHLWAENAKDTKKWCTLINKTNKVKPAAADGGSASGAGSTQQQIKQRRISIAYNLDISIESNSLTDDSPLAEREKAQQLANEKSYSSALKISNSKYQSPFVNVPTPPFKSVADIGFVEELNPRYRKTMEDGHCMIDGFSGEPKEGFFAVYDGHGGTEAVEYVQANLHRIIKEELDHVKHNSLQHMNNSITNAISRAYLRIDDEMKLKKIGTECGTTSATVLLREDIDIFGKAEKKLYVSNVGDTRVVLIRDGVGIPLTVDHRASGTGEDFEAEVNRIKAKKGVVAAHRVNGVISVTRSLGDHYMKEWIIPDPYHREVTCDPATDVALIIACDGLWDVVSNQQACQYVMEKRQESAQNIAEYLLAKALEARSKDNISIMVIKVF